MWRLIIPVVSCLAVFRLVQTRDHSQDGLARGNAPTMAQLTQVDCDQCSSQKQGLFV